MIVEDPVVARLRAAGCVFAEDEAALLVAEARDADELAALVEQRVAGRPLEQVLGWAEFAGLRITVEPDVFVPRRRTELLAAQAVSVVRTRGPASVVVELCCGSGAVSAVLHRDAPLAELYAADLDPAAVRCARRNLAGSSALVLEGDLDAPLPADLAGRVDVLVANTPYVPTDAVATMPPEARDAEPRMALDGGPDGLALARRLTAVAPRWLAAGGVLLIETSEAQAPLLTAEMNRHGLAAGVADDPEIGATVVLGRSLRRRRGGSPRST